MHAPDEPFFRAGGGCRETIRQIPDADERAIALGEYYYFSGQAEQAVEMVRPYLAHENILFRLSSSIIFAYANLTMQNLHDARMGLGQVQQIAKKLYEEFKEPQMQAIGVSVQAMACVLLHLPVPEGPHLEENLKYLPSGLKMYACYVLAHQEYLHGDHWECVGMAEMALSMHRRDIVIGKPIRYTVYHISQQQGSAEVVFS